MSFEGWTGTHEAESIADTATLMYDEVLGSGILLQSGTNAELVDKDLEYPAVNPPTQKYLSVLSPQFVGGFGSDLEIRKWSYDFGQESTVSVEIPFYSEIHGFGELMEVATLEIIIRRWDALNSTWVDVSSTLLSFDASDNPPEGTIKEITDILLESNITTSKIQIQVNAQALFDSNTYIAGWQAVFPEFIIFPSGLSLDVHPFKIRASTAGNSPVKMRVGDLTYSLPLVATDDPTASALRIFDGTNIKAFQKA